MLLGEQEPNISSWGKYLIYKQSRKRSTLLPHTTVCYPSIFKHRKLLFISPGFVPLPKLFRGAYKRKGLYPGGGGGRGEHEPRTKKSASKEEIELLIKTRCAFNFTGFYLSFKTSKSIKFITMDLERGLYSSGLIIRRVFSLTGTV